VWPTVSAMTTRLALPEDYVAYLAACVGGRERRLGPLVKSISDAYIGSARVRPTLTPLARSKAQRSVDPMAEAAARAEAYSFYYGPLTALKLQAIVSELEQRYPAWPPRTHLRVLDLGAGPGSATLGLLLADPRFEIEALWIDSDPAWEATDLARPWVESGALAVQRKTVDLARPIQGTFDLVLMANVLVELAEDASADPKLGTLLERRLEPDGVAILVEPATREVTRRLHRMRDALVASGWLVLAPCTGNGPCPMLLGTRDWCHETRDWIQPDFHHHLDQIAGLKKDALRFSFLAVSKQQLVPQHAVAARVVSEVRREKGRTRFDTCDESSQRSEWDAQQRDLRRHSALGEEVHELRRGALVRLPHSRGGRLGAGDDFGRIL